MGTDNFSRKGAGQNDRIFQAFERIITRAVLRGESPHERPKTAVERLGEYMEDSGTFGTAVNCMDGRTQLPVIEYLKKTFAVAHVDAITEAGPVKILAERTNLPIIDSFLRRIDISVHKHGSRLVAIVGHCDCAGNPGDKSMQLDQLEKASEFLAMKYPQCDVRKIWVGEDWTATEV